MNASGSDNVTSAIKPAELISGQAYPQGNIPGLAIETQLHSAADIASARSFFIPKADMPTSPLSGMEHAGAAAMKAAEGAISPMLQLIMRLPGHLGLFSSFLEAFKNLFFGHDLLNTFNLGDIASGIDLTHATNLTHATLLGHTIGALPANLHALHTMSLDMVSNAGTAHLHVNPFASLKQSMNVSSAVDLKNPQFEGVQASASDLGAHTKVSSSADSLAGPGLSGQAITPKLAPAERIFSNKSFESLSSNNSQPSNLLAINSQMPTPSITSGATNYNISSVSQASSNANSSSTAAPPDTESVTPHISSDVSGLQAKALSLDSVMPKGHSHFSSDHGLAINHRHLANNPFSKLASNTRQVFQSTRQDISATGGNSYSIKSGDNLWQIANRELGNGWRWRDIYNLNQNMLGNNPGIIHSGTSIRLPQSADGSIAEGSPSTSFDHSVAAHHAPTNHYTVKQGDSLWQISKNIFGSGDKWSQLYKLNGSTIGGNPGMIFSGQKLSLSGTIPSMHPHLTTHNAEQLAQHAAPSAPMIHNQPTLAQTHHAIANDKSIVAHAQQPIVHNQSTLAQTPHAIANDKSIVAHAQHPAVHNQSTVAHNKGNVGQQLKHENPVADNRIAHAPLHQQTAHGLTVEPAHDQLLSGAGGAQAANSTHSVSNKLSGLSSGKVKSVVSFSLTPDLAQW